MRCVTTWWSRTSPPRKARLRLEEMIILTPEQVKDFAVKLKGHRIYARAITALHTGVRPQELLALRWSAVDLDGRVPKAAEAINRALLEG